MPPFLQNLLALPAKTKALLGVSAVAILAIAFVMLKIATAPSYALIATGLDPAADRQDHRRARRAGHRLRAAEQRHGARRREGGDGAGADRARRRRASQTSARRHAAGLRAVRRAEARRLRLPAAGHLPARAGGRDRQHDRAASRASEPAGAARAAAGRPVRRRGHRRPRPRSCSATRPTRSSPAPCAASRSSSPPPSRASRPRTSRSPTRTGAAPVAAATRRGGAGGGGSSKQAPRRATPARWRPRSTRCSLRTLGPGKAQVKVNADLNVDKTTRGRADRTARRARRSRRPRRPRRCKGGGATRRRHRRHRLQRPDLLGANGSGGRRQLQLQAARRARPTTASTRRSPRPKVAAGARQQAQTSRCWSTSRSRADVVHVAEVDRRRAPPASTRRAATRSQAAQIAFAKPADAQGGPGADDDARPAQVGRPRPRQRSSSCSS